MKRLLSLLIAGVMTVGLFSGCGTAEKEPSSSGTAQTAQTNQTAQGTNEAVKEKILVVYYSATGTTEKVAGMIADAVGGALFELEPVQAYTAEDLDWTNSGSRVSREHENEAERDVELVAATVDDFQDVSVIYLGYPVWWGIAAWPVNNFVKNNDFSGKTVIPFCTSASSGIGDSGRLLSEMAGTGNWLEGKRFSSGTSAAEVREWLEGLGG